MSWSRFIQQNFHFYPKVKVKTNNYFRVKVTLCFVFVLLAAVENERL